MVLETAAERTKYRTDNGTFWAAILTEERLQKAIDWHNNFKEVTK